jgi:hypothetical protein
VPFLHMPWLVHVAMWVLAFASLVTVGQRLHTVRTSRGAMEPLTRTSSPGGENPGAANAGGESSESGP